MFKKEIQIGIRFKLMKPIDLLIKFSGKTLISYILISYVTRQLIQLNSIKGMVAHFLPTRLYNLVTYITGLFQKKITFFGQKISKILCLAFDFICIYYMSSDY